MIVFIGKNGLIGQHFTRLYPDIVALSRAECDLTRQTSIMDMFKLYKPSVVINAAGIVPKSQDIYDPYKTLMTNALGPRWLADYCSLSDCRLVQISSNDVFSGRGGKYREADLPNPTDLYGISKALGEIDNFPHVTVRTSVVGFPDERGHGLLAWASTQKRLIGFDRFLWNGLAAPELVRLIMEQVIPSARACIIHLHGETLSKYDVIKQAAEVFGWTVEIVRESDVAPSPHVVDKTLLAEHGIISPKTFKQQLEDMRTLWNESSLP